MNKLGNFEPIEEQNFSVEELELNMEELEVLKMNQKYRQNTQGGLYQYFAEEN